MEDTRSKIRERSYHFYYKRGCLTKKLRNLEKQLNKTPIENIKKLKDEDLTNLIFNYEKELTEIKFNKVKEKYKKWCGDGDTPH